MKSELEMLIEELESGAQTQPEAIRTPRNEQERQASRNDRHEVSEKIEINPKLGSWPSESIEAGRRFGQPHAKLFRFIGRKVLTPEGAGTLLQVFAERATVLLDSELQKCSFFHPSEILPVSRDLGDEKSLASLR